MAHHTFVCLKSYGDYVILRASLLNRQTNQLAILIGDHLSELDQALGEYTKIHMLPHREGNVPSIFDVKKNGFILAIRSAWKLKQLISNCQINNSSILVFDKLRIRERIIAGGHMSLELPSANNIYKSYYNFFNCYPNVQFLPSHSCPDRIVRNIGIFPGSRVSVKCIPQSITELIVKILSLQGFNPVLFLLDGEIADKFDCACDVVKVSRNFSAMAQAVKQVDAVISADSMPAHLAEYFGVPVFVVTPRPNRYWLPLSAFDNNYWCCFNDLTAKNNSLSLFLSSLTERVE